MITITKEDIALVERQRDKCVECVEGSAWQAWDRVLTRLRELHALEQLSPAGLQKRGPALPRSIEITAKGRKALAQGGR